MQLHQESRHLHIIACVLQMLNHHSITSTMIPAIGYSMRHHPHNPKTESEKRKDKREEEDMKSDLESARGETSSPPNPLTGSTDINIV